MIGLRRTPIPPSISTSTIRAVTATVGMRISSPLLPQVTAREARPFGERREFCPDYRRMHLARRGRTRKAAVGAGDHVLPPNHARKAYNPLCNELGVLNKIGGMGDDPGD